MENEMLRKDARTQKKHIEQKNGAGGGKRKQSSPQSESGHKKQRNNVEAEVVISAPASHVPIKIELKPEKNDDEVDFNHLSNSVSDPKLRDLSQEETPEDIRADLMKTIVGGETEEDESNELLENSVAVVSTVLKEENEVGSALELPPPATTIQAQRNAAEHNPKIPVDLVKIVKHNEDEFVIFKIRGAVNERKNIRIKVAKKDVFVYGRTCRFSKIEQIVKFHIPKKETGNVCKWDKWHACFDEINPDIIEAVTDRKKRRKTDTSISMYNGLYVYIGNQPKTLDGCNNDDMSAEELLEHWNAKDKRDKCEDVGGGDINDYLKKWEIDKEHFHTIMTSG